MRRDMGADSVSVELQETHEDRRGSRSVEHDPCPMQRLELTCCLPQVLGAMDRRSFYEHDLVPGPEERNRKQTFAHDHEQAEENPVARRLNAPTQNQGSGTGHPGEEPQGREEVVWSPDGHELQAGFKRSRRIMKDVGVHHERLHHDGAQEDHHHPQVDQDDWERELLYSLHPYSFGSDGGAAVIWASFGPARPRRASSSQHPLPDALSDGGAICARCDAFCTDRFSIPPHSTLAPCEAQGTAQPVAESSAEGWIRVVHRRFNRASETGTGLRKKGGGV